MDPLDAAFLDDAVTQAIGAQLETAAFEAFVADYRDKVGIYLAETARQEEAARSAPAVTDPPVSRGRGGTPIPDVNPGNHSDAWWHGVSICEQGGRNHPFFGYFSIMDGSAGGLDWDTQVRMANGIISRYGDGAWAASCVAAGYRASPGG